MEKNLFRAGVGVADITPPIGLAIEGGFTVVRGEKVLDPLFVSVVALSDGCQTLLLTSIDLCIVSNASYQEMVRQLEETLHLPASSLIIASTHTHGSPLMGTAIFEGIPSDPEYTSHTIKKFITAAKAALDNMVDARFACGSAESRDYLFNRRVVDPQGKIRMNFIDAEHLKDCRVEGEPDPELQLLRIEDLSGKPLALLVNYALHNNANIYNGPGYTADISGALRKHLHKLYGEDTAVLFMPSACGDINWIDLDRLDFCHRNDFYDRVGLSYAGKVAAIDADITSQTGAIRSLTRELVLMDRPYTDYEATVDFTFGPPETQKEIWDHYKADYAAHKDDPLKENHLHLSAFSLGEDFAVVTAPVELFCQYGMEIKAKSPFRHTMFWELTNGHEGYAPSPEAIAAGGYEARKLVRDTHLEIHAAEKIAAACLEMLEELKKQ